jgi:zinc protease
MSQIAAGLKREANDPDFVAGRNFRAAAYPNHPYGLPVRGDLSTLPALTRSHLIDLRAVTFARDNLKIAAVGAIDAETLASHLDDIFGQLPDKASLIPVAPAAFAGAGTRHVAPIDVPQSTIRFGREGIARKDPDFIAATVVNHILGGGIFSARLFREVREKRGLAYSVSDSLVWLNHTALFLGATATRADRAGETLELIDKEIHRLAENGPTADELAKAKAYLNGSFALNLDTSSKIAGLLVQLQLDGLGIDYFTERPKMINAVTLANARRVARRLLDGGLLVTVVGRPEGLAAKAAD